MKIYEPNRESFQNYIPLNVNNQFLEIFIIDESMNMLLSILLYHHDVGPVYSQGSSRLEAVIDITAKNGYHSSNPRSQNLCRNVVQSMLLKTEWELEAKLFAMEPFFLSD